MVNNICLFYPAKKNSIYLCGKFVDKTGSNAI